MKKARFPCDMDLIKRIFPCALVIVIQMFIAYASLNMLSIVRAYVAGESRWSKGQKDAVYFLTRYADTGDEQYFLRYLDALAAPMGDLSGRVALEQPTPDVSLATQSFLQGGNHPDDVPGLIFLFLHFRDAPYFEEAVASWKATDSPLLELSALGGSVRASLARGPVTLDELRSLKTRIYQFNEHMTPFAVAFSESLGTGSRAVRNILTIVNFITAAVLISLLGWHTRILLVQRRRFESALKGEQERAQITLASIGDAVIRVDMKGRIQYLNPAAQRLIGPIAATAQGSPLTSLISLVDKTTEEERDGLITALLAGEGIQGEAQNDILLRGCSGAVPVSLVGTRVDIDGEAMGAVLVFHDMTYEQEYIERLSWQASHDTLTGLANRREFERRLEKGIQGLAEHRAQHALMFLDLDQFKIVNDTCGHAAGDQLLRKVTESLLRELRKSDVLARLGGDEFGVLLQDCAPEEGFRVAERLRRSVERSGFVWEGRPFNTTISIGLVSMATSNASLEETLRAADMACYLAKENGRNRVEAYQPSDSDLLRRVREMAWVQRIHEGLDKMRFCLFAQRIIPLNPRDNSGEHAELLLRLRDENGRLVPPNSFIPAAERYGLMPKIDRWVVCNAFANLARLTHRSGAGRPAICAINISGVSVGDREFVGYIREQFKAHGIPPAMICFEITETAAISNLEKADRFIRELQELGCKFSLDDFGTGMSSFAYLKRLPVNSLKIDGSFVKNMLNDPTDRAMVEMVSRLAGAMGKRTIAEFVENEEILEALREIGVDYAQGFAIGTPQPFPGCYAHLDEEEDLTSQVA